MSSSRRIRVVVAIVALLSSVAVAAQAQTRKLTIHMNPASAAGDVRVFSGGVSPVSACTPSGNNPCVVFLNQGSAVEIAADYPGRLSAGTGPAAACALSTCSFTMTADADVTATFTSGDGPFATLTAILAGDGGGTLWADGLPCQSGSCAVKYLTGSTVHVSATSGTARFTGYSSGTGDASACGASPTCSFTLNADAAVTGTFLALTSFTVFPPSAVAAPGGAAVTFTATGSYSGGSRVAIAATQGAWSAAPSLPAGRVNLAAAALSSKVYAIGGGDGAFGVVNTLTEFDPVTQTWTARASMLTGRSLLGAAIAGSQLYAIGGFNGALGSNHTLASVESYDPATNIWTTRAPMAAARSAMVTGTINGIVYAAGGINDGGSPVSTLEAYNPATDTWTQKAPVPGSRGFAAGGVIDGILYVAGGSTGLGTVSDVIAYNPATNTWTSRAPLPVPLDGAASAVADGVLYVLNGTLYDQSVVYAYDPVADAWSVKSPMRTPLSELAATSLNGIVYAIGGSSVDTSHTVKLSTVVQTFVDGVRWSSSAPSVARITQAGAATPLVSGVATIVANVGGTTCGTSCPTFFVVPPTTLSLDAPVNNFTIAAGRELTIGGWALNTAAPSGTGVDLIHVHATASGPPPPPGVGVPTFFLGAAQYGESRPDVGAVYGSQFTNSGFTLKTSAMTVVGDYTITAYARNAITQLFDVAKSANIHVTPAASSPFMNIDTPANGQVLTSAFEVGGWAIDAGAFTGTGVDAVQVYVFPNDGSAPGVFIGHASYGSARADVGALFGSRFTNSGYHFTITGLGPGPFMLGVYARSTLTGSFSIVKTLHFTVSATALMSIDSPQPEVAITANTIGVAGWSIDRTIEASGPTGTGVDLLHVYAYPNPGSGQAPIFLGVASVGVNRPDVGALYGSRYNSSGYTLTVDRAAAGLTPGTYNIVVHSHSAVTNAFNNVALVRVTLQ